MGYANVFTKLDQDISHQIKNLQAKQQELIEKKKKLLTTKQKIQGFLSDAQEIKNIVANEPELIKSIQTELNNIFSGDIQPKLPIKKETKLPINSEEESKNTTNSDQSNNLEAEEEESLKIFKFIDTQGKNTSF